MGVVSDDRQKIACHLTSTIKLCLLIINIPIYGMKYLNVTQF